MPHPNDTEKGEVAMNEKTNDSRREFLGRAGKIAVTAPAAALLLAASSKSQQAMAASGPEQCVSCNPP